MGRSSKSKSHAGNRANAPEFQILQQHQQQQQPPVNPYYQDPSGQSLLHSNPPPPYSDLTVPINSNISSHQHYPNAVQMAQINYPRLNPVANTGGHVPINIQSAGVPYDRRTERYSRKVRSFNSQTLLIAILAVVLSLWAYNLFEGRYCVWDFTVIKPSKDLEVKIRDVRDLHLTVAGLSGLIALLCIAKAATGYNSKSYACYLCLMAIFSLLATFVTGYLAYLSFYTTCSPSAGELVAKAGKTILAQFVDSLPAPELRKLGESNVLEMAKNDRNGVLIFIFDMINFVFYASVFLTSSIIC